MVAWRRIALPVWCMSLAGLWLAASAPDPASENIRRHDEVTAVPVQHGVATFDLPSGGKHDQFLLMISSLSSQGGPFSVDVSSEPIGDPGPLVSVRATADAEWLNRVDQLRQQLQFVRGVIEPAEATVRIATPAAERVFWIMVRGDDFVRAQNYQAVQGRLTKVGEHCAAYVDAECPPSRQLEDLVDDAVRTFDRDIFPTAARKLGWHRDVDGDGRFAILFTPWLGRLADGAVALGGFVRGSDFYSDLEPPLSNRCDMMYLNADLRSGPHLRTLIAHEYTHAVTISQRVFGRYVNDRVGHEEESWLDESLAHVAENLHAYSWSNLDYRISGFLCAPERFQLVVEDYYAADLWRGHGNRGSTYLFLRWCVDQFGEQILSDLVQTNLCGIENVEVTTRRPFAELYRDWSAALFLSHSGLASRSEEEFRFLNPRGELAGRLLAGPRYDFLTLNRDSRQFLLAGTSTKYFLAHSPGGSGTRVHIACEPAAALQVSVRKMPHDMARLELQAVPLSPSENDGTGLELRLTEHNGTSVTLQRFSWETLPFGSNKDDRRGVCGRILSASEVADLFGSTTVPASGGLVGSFLTKERLQPGGAPVVLKVTGRDSRGHAISAWCTVELDQPVLAENSDVKR